MTQAHDPLLDGLNPQQREAVLHVDGPLLIVAGPGSGKTRVITHRIAYLVQRVGVSPGRIGAVTFTNRAAREMRTRLEALLGSRAGALTAGTFHSLCVRILRADGEHIGLQRDFVIMDDDDQQGLVKRAMELAEVDPKRFPHRQILNAISAAKSQLLGPEALGGSNAYYEEVVRRVFVQYQALLARSHAVDFDDLLTKVAELFREAPEVLRRYQERFIHLMVDEFQDTNVVQYHLARELAGKYRNLAVVGDPDQSIYSWRNADIRNILSFQKDYPDAKTINLGQNYRSSANILEAARGVIAANKKRLDQNLFTENARGEPIAVAEAYTEEEEAQAVLEEVERLTREEGYGLADCVVTFRVNAQSRAMEEACLRHGVPYRLIGGVRFYQRREVKDALAYLRLVQDPYDEASLVRVINTPTRGIGKRTVDDLLAWAHRQSLPAYAALQLLAGDEETGTPPADSPFDARQRRGLVEFLGLLNGLQEAAGQVELAELVDEVLERTGYRAMLLNSEEPDAEDRLDNLRELRGVAADQAGAPAAETLAVFLENTALVQEQDKLDPEGPQYLTLITLHQIKGLEYPVVFMTGVEEGVLPHMRSLDDPDQLEEERRIAYVGMTRAKERLYLFRSFRRRLAGQTGATVPSRFLRDVPPTLLKPMGRLGASAPTPVTTGRSMTGVVGRPAPAGKPSDGPSPFGTGEKVRHASFGEGIVVSCTPKGGDFEVTVAFKGASGVKRLLASFAKLERTG
jgi:DNA helicase-2/ATP-dependent DNA helicase PcrA